MVETQRTAAPLELSDEAIEQIIAAATTRAVEAMREEIYDAKPRAMRARSAAEYIAGSVSTLRNLTDLGRIRCVYVASEKRWLREDLDEYLDSGTDCAVKVSTEARRRRERKNGNNNTSAMKPANLQTDE